MVRPAARYRPAARRFGGTDPLWVVTNPFSYNPYEPNDALTRTVALYRGSLGWLTEYQPWAVASPPSVGSGDGGLLAALVSWYGANSYRIDSSQWTGQVRRACFPMVVEVIDGVAYIALLRGVFTTGKARVGWTQLGPTGAPLAGASGVEESALMASSARYDFLYSTIDLETGVTVHNSAPLYQYDCTVGSATGVFSGPTRQYHWSVSLNYGGFKEALTSLFPSSHPFHSCSASALYGYLSSSWMPLGPSTFTSAAGGSSTPLVTTNNFANSFQPPYHFWDITNGPLFSKTLSLSTQSDQHVVSTVQSGVRLYELATLDALGPTPPARAYRECSNYRYLGLPGPTSFSSYAPELVEPAETQLDWTGLGPEDQTKVRDGVPGPLPASVSPTHYSLSTIDPTIFSSYAQPLSFEVGKTSYLMFIL